MEFKPFLLAPYMVKYVLYLIEMWRLAIEVADYEILMDLHSFFGR